MEVRVECSIPAGTTILLLDDNIHLLHAIGELLRAFGYSVIEHSDPLEALECFQVNEHLNVVLTDIDMPGMDGVTLLAELRRMRPLMKGIFMTGRPRRLERSEEVLRKPFTSAELVQALENVWKKLPDSSDADEEQPFVA
jgi:CheY-like chemotaxis protein